MSTDTNYRIRRDVLVHGERGVNPETGKPFPRTTVVGSFPVVLFRVEHTDSSRKQWERQCDRRGVEWKRVGDDSSSVYEVWGPVVSLERLSRESVVIDRDSSHPCLLVTDTPIRGVDRFGLVGSR